MQLFYTNNYDNTAFKPVFIRVGYNRPWCKKSLNVMGASKAESGVLSHFKKTNQQHIYYQLYLEVQKVTCNHSDLFGVSIYKNCTALYTG